VSASGVTTSAVTFTGVSIPSTQDGHYMIGTTSKSASPLPMKLVLFDGE